MKWEANASFRSPFYLPYTTYENSGEFIGLLVQRRQTLILHNPRPREEFEPVSGLFKFLQADLEFTHNLSI